jgi:hypothetical protein
MVCERSVVICGLCVAIFSRREQLVPGHTVILMQDFAAVAVHAVMRQSCGAYMMHHRTYGFARHALLMLSS